MILRKSVHTFLLLLSFLLLTKFSFAFTTECETNSECVLADNNSTIAKGDEIKFVQHLITIKNFDEAVLYIHQLMLKPAETIVGSKFYSDSLYYYEGLCLFNQQKLDSSLTCWNHISLAKDNPLLITTQFHRASVFLRNNNYPAFETTMNDFKTYTLNENENELLKMYQAAYFIMKDKPLAYDSICKTMAMGNYIIKDEMTDINIVAKKLMHPKKKYGAVAGLMSAIVPGTGKFYAGYKGAPFGAMMPNIILAAVAVENLYNGVFNYRTLTSNVIDGKYNFKSWNFIAAASLFSIFYVGNIVGSTYSVKIKANENKKYYKSIVLFNLYNTLQRLYPE